MRPHNRSHLKRETTWFFSQACVLVRVSACEHTCVYVSVCTCTCVYSGTLTCLCTCEGQECTSGVSLYHYVSLLVRVSLSRSLLLLLEWLASEVLDPFLALGSQRPAATSCFITVGADCLDPGFHAFCSGRFTH